MLRSLLARNIVVCETAVDPDGEAATLLPGEEAFVARAVPSRRREYAAGRHCARRALAQLGIQAFPLLQDAKRVPVWPSGVVGSISHGAGWCAAAVAGEEVAAGLGVDIEDASPLGRDLVPRICRLDERAPLEELPRIDGLDWYKLLFSAKESVYKAYFPLARTFLEFHDVQIALAPPDASEGATAGSFEAVLLRDDAPAAAGARRFRGRYGIAGARVYTAVALPPRDSDRSEGGRE